MKFKRITLLCFVPLISVESKNRKFYQYCFQNIVKMKPDNDFILAQSATFTLRDTFLKAMLKLKDTPCTILTHEQSNLEAVFSVWKPDSSEILVTDLKTPANVKLDSAILRTSDVISLRFKKSVVDN